MSIKVIKPARAEDTKGLIKVLFGQAIPFGTSAVSELEVGKKGVTNIWFNDATVVFTVRTDEGFNTQYYVPWSRVSCAWYGAQMKVPYRPMPGANFHDLKQARWHYEEEIRSRRACVRGYIGAIRAAQKQIAYINQQFVERGYCEICDYADYDEDCPKHLTWRDEGYNDKDL